MQSDPIAETLVFVVARGGQDEDYSGGKEVQTFRGELSSDLDALTRDTMRGLLVIRTSYLKLVSPSVSGSRKSLIEGSP